MVDHGVVVWALPAPRLTEALWFGVGAEVHVREVHPDKNWLARFVLPLDEVDSPVSDVIVDGYHPALGQRACVLADLLADLAEARVNSRVVLVRGFAVHDAPRSELSAEAGVFRV